MVSLLTVSPVTVVKPGHRRISHGFSLLAHQPKTAAAREIRKPHIAEPWDSLWVRPHAAAAAVAVRATGLINRAVGTSAEPVCPPIFRQCINASWQLSELYSRLTMAWDGLWMAHHDAAQK